LPAPTGKVPVIVVLHGSAVTPAYEEHRTGFLPVVGSAIVVYPTGYGETWNAGHCCGAAHAAGLNDEAFITAVVAQVLAEHPNADAAKVDLVGYSNGGRLAWSLACDDPSVFRAVAVYGAVLDESCSHLGPISAIEIAGRADPELTIDSSKPATVSFGFTEPTVTAMTAQLRASDGCSATSSVNTHGRATTTTWAGCAGDRRVALALYQGQDHSWPAGGGTTPSAEVLIWRFFVSLGAT
jgi:polyhydroxybutyrate depolymerase